MGAAKAPESPDPKETAQAQTATNVASAQANSILGNANQFTPTGSITYTNGTPQFIADKTTGQTYWTDGKGNYQSNRPTLNNGTPDRVTQVKVPQYRTTRDGQRVLSGYVMKDSVEKGTSNGFDPAWSQVQGYMVTPQTATTTLSPEQQKIFDQTQAAQLNLGTIANNQSGFLKDYLSNRVDLSKENVDRYINDRYSDDFDKSWNGNQSTLATQLANQGIQLGSAAYTKAMDDFNISRSSARDNLYGNQYAQAVQNILTERNQPLNEISALLSGSQVSMPTPANYNATQVPTTDYAGLVQQKYASDMAAYQQSQQNRQAMFGGLFSLGGSLLAAPMTGGTSLAGKLMGY